MNEEVLRRALRDLNETEEFALEFYDPAVVWTTRADGPSHETYTGHEGLQRGMRSFREAWSEIRGEITEIRGTGDVLVAVIRWRLRGRSGVQLEVVEGWAYWFRDAKISRMEQHGSPEDALVSAGLNE